MRAPGDSALKCRNTPTNCWKAWPEQTVNGRRLISSPLILIDQPKNAGNMTFFRFHFSRVGMPGGTVLANCIVSDFSLLSYRRRYYLLICEMAEGHLGYPRNHHPSICGLQFGRIDAARAVPDFLAMI
jgi:hypothetical protein